jgi:acid phosphatase type 7
MMRFSLILGFLIACPLTAGAGIVKGPYLQDARTDRVTVVVETDDDTTCTAWYGEGLKQSKSLTATGEHHEGVIDGLEASTCYRYQVRCGALSGPEASFCTAPLPDEPFSFVVFGDTRTNHDDHAAVMRALKAEGVDFFINTGDLVSSGEVEEDWVTFFETESDLLRELPLYPVIGNHDEDGGNVDIYTRLFAPPTESSESENYYAFTWGNTRFIVLDNQSMWLGRPVDHTEQGDWFGAELERTAGDESIEHVFVLVHANMYSVKDGRAGDEGLRLWQDEMLENGVDYVFSGHDHHYMRGLAENGLPFVVSGGGGAPLYEIREEFYTEDEPIEAAVWGWLPEPGDKPFTITMTRMVNHYIRIDVLGSYFSASVREVQGSADQPGVEFDSFSEGEIPEPPRPADSSGCATAAPPMGAGFVGLIGLLVWLLRRRSGKVRVRRRT